MSFKNLLLWLLYFGCWAVLLPSGTYLSDQEARLNDVIVGATDGQANAIIGHESIAFNDDDSVRLFFVGSILDLTYLTLRKSTRNLQEWAKDFVLVYKKRQRQRLEKKSRKLQTNQSMQMDLMRGYLVFDGKAF